MKSAITGREAARNEELLVHDWRVARLAQFGIPQSLAEVYADHIDWHHVARLVQRGCPLGWPCASSCDERLQFSRITLMRRNCGM